ncbi:MAG: putative signal transduction histidine kinase, partial [Bacteroidetes bacterium]
MKRKFLLLILFPVLSLSVSAQFLPFRNFQAKDGLPSSEVYFVMQDHLGYMWFGTDAGISRYDGYSFQNFTTNDGLCDNTVFQLFEDRHQRIWCRTISGCISYFRDGRFTTIGASTAIRGEMSNLLLTELYVDKNDTLWLGTQNKKIIRVAPPYTAQSMHVFPDSSTQVRIFDQGIVYSKGDMIGGQKGTQACVRFKNQFGSVLAADTVVDFFITRCVREDAEKTLIAFGKKLYRFASGRLTEIFSSDAIILSIYKDQQNRIWLGLIDNGLVILEQHQNAYRVSHRYLGNDRLSFITRDYEGGTWISSLKNGVFYLPRQGIEQYTGNSGSDNR